MSDALDRLEALLAEAEAGHTVDGCDCEQGCKRCEADTALRNLAPALIAVAREARSAHLWVEPKAIRISTQKHVNDHLLERIEALDAAIEKELGDSDG